MTIEAIKELKITDIADQLEGFEPIKQKGSGFLYKTPFSDDPSHLAVYSKGFNWIKDGITGSNAYDFISWYLQMNQQSHEAADIFAFAAPYLADLERLQSERINNLRNRRFPAKDSHTVYKAQNLNNQAQSPSVYKTQIPTDQKAQSLPSKVKVKGFGPLTNPFLSFFKEKKGIPFQLSAKYLKLMKYTVGEFHYDAPAFANNFKGCVYRNIKTNKLYNYGEQGYSFIKGASNHKIVVFENHTDFLTYLAQRELEIPDYDCLITNGTSNFGDEHTNKPEKAYSFLKSQAYPHALLFLQNDDPYKAALAQTNHFIEAVMALMPHSIDKRSEYAGHKDLNEYWCKRLKLNPDIYNSVMEPDPERSLLKVGVFFREVRTEGEKDRTYFYSKDQLFEREKGYSPDDLGDLGFLTGLSCYDYIIAYKRKHQANIKEMRLYANQIKDPRNGLPVLIQTIKN